MQLALNTKKNNQVDCCKFKIWQPSFASVIKGPPSPE